MNLLELISVISILPPGGMVFFLWKRLAMPFRIIAFMIIFTMIMEAVGAYYYTHHLNNLFLFWIFTWVEGIALTIYFVLISEKQSYKKAFYIWGIVFILISVYAGIFGEPFDHYNSMHRSIGSIWGIILCILFLFQIFQQSVITNLLGYAHYWMTSAFLLYFAGMLFLNLVADYVLSNDTITFNPFIIHSFLNIFLNIIYTIVLWMGSSKAILRRS